MKIPTRILVPSFFILLLMAFFIVMHFKYPDNSMGLFFAMIMPMYILDIISEYVTNKKTKLWDSRPVPFNAEETYLYKRRLMISGIIYGVIVLASIFILLQYNILIADVKQYYIFLGLFIIILPILKFMYYKDNDYKKG